MIMGTNLSSSTRMLPENVSQMSCLMRSRASGSAFSRSARCRAFRSLWLGMRLTGQLLADSTGYVMSGETLRKSPLRVRISREIHGICAW